MWKAATLFLFGTFFLIVGGIGDIEGESHIFLKPLLEVGSPAVVVQEEEESFFQCFYLVVGVVKVFLSGRYQWCIQRGQRKLS